MKTVSIVWLALSLVACARPTVRCDGHLEPINAPRPVVDRSAADARTDAQP